MSERIWTPPGGSADARRERAGEQEQAQREPTEQELADRYREELKRVKVSDLVAQTLFTISSLGYHKLSPEGRDLGQARLAIEAMRALVPVLEGEAPEEVLRDFKQVVANMQLAYADAVKQQERPAATPSEETPEAGRGE
jgi:hypothetical protein